MKLRTLVLLLASIMPINIHASEMCAKFMEADMEFRSIGKVTEFALRKYADSYMDAAPGGRKSDDDLINLKLALQWRGYCPDAHLTPWPRVFHLWQKYIYMDEDARKAAACTLLVNVDRKYWELPKMDRNDYWYASTLHGYANGHLEAYSQWVSSLQGVDPEVALKAVIDFHNAECSGAHHWTAEAFNDWKNIKKQP